MSLAFAITTEDISNVFLLFGIDLDPDSERADELLGELDTVAIENSALMTDFGSEYDDEQILTMQTTVAYEEIARQLGLGPVAV